MFHLQLRLLGSVISRPKLVPLGFKPPIKLHVSSVPSRVVSRVWHTQLTTLRGPPVKRMKAGLSHVLRIQLLFSGNDGNNDGPYRALNILNVNV
jgi:hypothetical protein